MYCAFCSIFFTSGKSPLEGAFRYHMRTFADQSLYSAMNFRTAPRPTYLSSSLPTTSVGA